MSGYKSRRLREAAVARRLKPNREAMSRAYGVPRVMLPTNPPKYPNADKWWQEYAASDIPHSARRPPDTCFCGGPLRAMNWEERDGVLVSGLWRCLTDDEHFVKLAEGPIREFWQPPRMPRQ